MESMRRFGRYGGETQGETGIIAAVAISWSDSLAWFLVDAILQ
jgi:hypothetical protein